jgi:hypothetical protein
MFENVVELNANHDFIECHIFHVIGLILNESQVTPNAETHQ